MGFMVKRGRKGLPPVKVAEAVYAGLTDATPKLNTILTPEPFQQWLMNVLPSRMVDKMIAKRLGLTPDARR